MMEVQREKAFVPKDNGQAHPENTDDVQRLKSVKTPPKVLFVVVFASFLVVAGVLLSGLLPRFATEEQLAIEQKAKRSATLTPAVVIHQAPAQSNLVLPANLQAVQEIPVFARCAGYLKDCLVDIGDKVTKGQTLAVIDTPELDQQLDQAKADLKEAVAQVKTAQADLARAQATLVTSKANLKRLEANLLFSKREIGRYTELESQGAISREQRDEKERNLDADTAAIEAAKADITANLAEIASFRQKVEVDLARVESAHANLGRVTSLVGFKNVKAPCAGIITNKNVDPGTLINEGSASNVRELLKLSRIDVLKVFVQVPQNFCQAVHPGLPAALMVAEFPEKKFLAKVSRVSGGLDASSRTMQVEVRIDNPNDILKPGMYGTIDFNLKNEITGNNRTALLIPASSLVVKPEGLFVAVIGSGGQVHFARVTLGRDYGKEVEVKTGIKDGETILLDPNIDLKEGSKVHTELSGWSPRA